jgi:hypothetical protein
MGWRAAIAAKSAVMLVAPSAPPAALLDPALLDSVLLDSVLLDSELLDDRGAELSLLDSLDDDVDSFELAAGELVPHEAITRLTENRAAASTDFLPMNIRTPFGCTKRRVARSE